MASNYRPVSLTCIMSKVMEHIIVKHILNHIDLHKILTIFQHGFRSAHSCETQLLLTVDDLCKSHDKKTQVDVGVLDFSRAFDTVPHKRLIAKLYHYGIRGPILNWIRSFLENRHMWVVVDGASSPKTKVDSGVPQGTVLGPLLFLLFINDLPNHVSPGTVVRLFADDCLVYREINSPADQEILQRDLTALNNWAHTWGMRFNPAKCNVMTIARCKTPFARIYTFCGEALVSVDHAKYLGITISNNLEWSKHVDIVTKKASNTLNFVRRNLKYCPRKCKETAYFSLARSTLEYSAAVWDPHLKKDKDKVERVNRRAARFVKDDYGPRSSVTQMMQSLNWPTLEDRRRDQRLTMMYKITNGLVAVPSDQLLPADSRTRASHNHKYRTISANTSVYRHSFFPRTVPEWNSLPKATAEAPTLGQFKTSLTR